MGKMEIAWLHACVGIDGHVASWVNRRGSDTLMDVWMGKMTDEWDGWMRISSLYRYVHVPKQPS